MATISESIKSNHRTIIFFTFLAVFFMVTSCGVHNIIPSYQSY